MAFSDLAIRALYVLESGRHSLSGLRALMPDAVGGFSVISRKSGGALQLAFDWEA
jgi:hypothetical protein